MKRKQNRFLVNFLTVSHVLSISVQFRLLCLAGKARIVPFGGHHFTQFNRYWLSLSLVSQNTNKNEPTKQLIKPKLDNFLQFLLLLT